MPPTTIARQDQAYQLFNDLRMAIDAHLASKKIKSVTAIVEELLAKQQQQQQQIDQLQQQQQQQQQGLDELRQQVNGLQQRQNERDEEQEQEQGMQERLEFDALAASQRRDSVLALGTGTARARSGSANTAAMGPAVEPASPASPTSSTSGDTEVLTPTINPPSQSKTGELDQAVAPGPVGAPAPAPSALGLPQLQMQDDQVKPARSKMKDSTNSPVRPAAGGSSLPFLCTSTQHVEKSYYLGTLVPQPHTTDDTSGIVCSHGAAAAQLGRARVTDSCPFHARTGRATRR